MGGAAERGIAEDSAELGLFPLELSFLTEGYLSLCSSSFLGDFLSLWSPFPLLGWWLLFSWLLRSPPLPLRLLGALVHLLLMFSLSALSLCSCPKDDVNTFLFVSFLADLWRAPPAAALGTERSLLSRGVDLPGPVEW
jgi:hypothetical protein